MNKASVMPMPSKLRRDRLFILFSFASIRDIAFLIRVRAFLLDAATKNSKYNPPAKPAYTATAFPDRARIIPTTRAGIAQATNPTP